MQEERYTTKVTVGLILIKEDRVLLIKRKNTGYMDGMYAFVAGHVEKGESLKQAMIREANEEAGIKIDENDIEFVCLIRDGKKNDEYINFYFKAYKYSGDIKIAEEDKCEEITWTRIEDIPQNMIPNDLRAIQNMKDKIYLDEYNWK